MSQRAVVVATVLSSMCFACTTQAVGLASGGPAAAGYTLDRTVVAARADAAGRTGVAPAALKLISADHVIWSDGSLGCPRPGLLYPQALVPGYRVRLRGPMGDMDYHASARGALVLCPAGRAVDPLPGLSRI